MAFKDSNRDRKQDASAKTNALGPQDGDYWLTRCAWCERVFGEEDPVFAMGLSLTDLALRELEPGKPHPLYLPTAQRSVGLILVTGDSEAKRRGKDALIQVCGEECGGLIKQALSQDLK